MQFIIKHWVIISGLIGTVPIIKILMTINEHNKRLFTDYIKIHPADLLTKRGLFINFSDDKYNFEKVVELLDNLEYCRQQEIKARGIYFANYYYSKLLKIGQEVKEIRDNLDSNWWTTDPKTSFKDETGDIKQIDRLSNALWDFVKWKDGVFWWWT